MHVHVKSPTSLFHLCWQTSSEIRKHNQMAIHVQTALWAHITLCFVYPDMADWSVSFRSKVMQWFYMIDLHRIRQVTTGNWGGSCPQKCYLLTSLPKKFPCHPPKCGWLRACMQLHRIWLLDGVSSMFHNGNTLSFHTCSYMHVCLSSQSVHPVCLTLLSAFIGEYINVTKS